MVWRTLALTLWGGTFCLFAGDLERIVNLLLSLCGRLSRIDRTLLCLQRDELRTEGAAEEKVRRFWKSPPEGAHVPAVIQNCSYKT